MLGLFTLPMLLVQSLVVSKLLCIQTVFNVFLILTLLDLTHQLILQDLRRLRLYYLTLHVILKMRLLLFEFLPVDVERGKSVLLVVSSTTDGFGGCLLLLHLLLVFLCNLLKVDASLSDLSIADLYALLDKTHIGLKLSSLHVAHSVALNLQIHFVHLLQTACILGFSCFLSSTIPGVILILLV